MKFRVAFHAKPLDAVLEDEIKDGSYQAVPDDYWDAGLAAAKLQAEERQEADVKQAAAKLLAEAHDQEEKEQSEQAVAEQKAQVEAQFEKAKERVLSEAAATISKAEAKKNKLEKAVASGQKLGANDDAFLNLNPPLNPPEQYDPFSNLDPPIVRKGSRAVLKGEEVKQEKQAPKVQNAAAGKALAADKQVQSLERELRKAKDKAAKEIGRAHV